MNHDKSDLKKLADIIESHGNQLLLNEAPAYYPLKVKDFIHFAKQAIDIAYNLGVVATLREEAIRLERTSNNVKTYSELCEPSDLGQVQ